MSNEELASRRLQSFQSRCGSYGETALKLACHAALPAALNAELVHLLKQWFVAMRRELDELAHIELNEEPKPAFPPLLPFKFDVVIIDKTMIIYAPNMTLLNFQS